MINIPRGKFLVSKLTDPPDASGERKILRPVARPWASANDLPWGHVCERGTLSGTGGWLRVPWWTRHDFHHHVRQRPSPGGPRKRRRGKGRHAVTGCAPGSRGRVFRAGPRDGADRTGLERGREGCLTPGTLFLRRPPDSSTVLEVPFRCLVSRRPAQHQGWAGPPRPSRARGLERLRSRC